MRILGFSLLFFASTPAWAAPVVTITKPASGANTGDGLTISASIESPYVVTSTVARVGNVAVNLTAQNGGGWDGTLDIGAVPLGPTTLSVSATDAFGDTTVASVPLTHVSSLFGVTSSIPPGSVARPNIHVSARCNGGPSGCKSLVVSVAPSTVVAEAYTAVDGNIAIDRWVSLAAFEGGAPTLHTEAVDNADHVVTSDVSVFVESSPKLIEVDHVEGRIVDVDDGRILFVAGAGLALKDRAAGTITMIAPDLPQTAILTPTGALWEGGEWSSGVHTTNGISQLRANGSWVVYVEGTAAKRRNLATGIVDLVADPAWTARVGPEGHVAYATAPDSRTYEQTVILFDGVTSTPVGTFPVLTSWLGDIAVDGDNVLFSGWGDTHQRNVIRSLRTSAGTLLLGPETPDAYGATGEAGVTYALRDGWAFYKQAFNAAPALFARAPDGTTGLASPRAISKIAGLSATELAYDGENDHRRYLTTRGSLSDAWIGGALGTLRRLTPSWFSFMGGTLFRVDPNGTQLPDPGGPPPTPAPPSAAGAGSPSVDPPSVAAPAPLDRLDAGGGGCRAAKEAPGAFGFIGLVALVGAFRRRMRRQS